MDRYCFANIEGRKSDNLKQARLREIDHTRSQQQVVVIQRAFNRRRFRVWRLLLAVECLWREPLPAIAGRLML